MKITSRSLWRFSLSMPAAASAESQDDQNACMNDAFTVCGQAIPDRDRVAACLAQNIKRISPACRAVMQRYSKGSTADAARARRRQRDRLVCSGGIR